MSIDPFHIVAIPCYDPLTKISGIRYLSHIDYHCQTTTQLVECRLYKTSLSANKAAETFNVSYKNRSNEAAKYHRTLYGSAIAMTLSGDLSLDSLEPIFTLANTPWQCPISGLWYNLAQGQRPTQPSKLH